MRIFIDPHQQSSDLCSCQSSVLVELETLTELLVAVALTETRWEVLELPSIDVSTQLVDLVTTLPSGETVL